MSTNTLSPNKQAIEDPFLTDSDYRAEARKAINAHLNACHEEIKKAGITPPEWPTLDDKTVSGLAASMLWRNRWLLTFDLDTMKQHLTLVPPDAVLLTKEQIKNGIGFILPGYRLIDQQLYNQLTAKIQGKPLLNVDFSHRISHGNHKTIENELFDTLSIILEELSGMFGALVNLLQTSEENKLGASIATCIDQELKNFDLLLDANEESFQDDFVQKLKSVHHELHEMHGVLIDSLVSSEKDKFGLSLAMAVDQRLCDINSLINAYAEQSQKQEGTEQPEELAIASEEGAE